MLNTIHAAVCPYCGLVIVADTARKSALCPACDKRFTLSVATLLEARLQGEEDDE